MTSVRRVLYSLLVPALIAGLPTRLVAQDLDTAQVRLQVEALHRRILADPGLPPAHRGKPFDRLLDGLGWAQVLRLDDAEMRSAVKAFEETLTGLDAATCDGLTREGSPDRSSSLALGLGLFARADSALLDRWSDVLVAMLRVKVDKTTPGPVATEAEANEVMGGVIMRLPADEQQRLIAGLESADPIERCWSLRVFFREISLLPPDQLGPLARSIVSRQ
jgi:hypothetical protein